LLVSVLSDDVTDVIVPGFESPNSDQEKATRAALGGVFTMIQGPPGAVTVDYVGTELFFSSKQFVYRLCATYGQEYNSFFKYLIQVTSYKKRSHMKSVVTHLSVFSSLYSQKDSKLSWPITETVANSYRPV